VTRSVGNPFATSFDPRSTDNQSLTEGPTWLGPGVSVAMCFLFRRWALGKRLCSLREVYVTLWPPTASAMRSRLGSGGWGPLSVGQMAFGPTGSCIFLANLFYRTEAFPATLSLWRRRCFSRSAACRRCHSFTDHGRSGDKPMANDGICGRPCLVIHTSEIFDLKPIKSKRKISDLKGTWIWRRSSS